MAEGSLQSIDDHLRELRHRLGWFVVALIIGTVIAYIYRLEVIKWLSRPLGLPLFYNNPAGGFVYIFKVCLSVGLVFAIPIGVFNIIRFVEPAFPKKRVSFLRILSIIVTSTSLAVMGIVFAYYLILPVSFGFFARYNVGGIRPLISTSEYFSFVAGCLVVFAFISQIPLLFLFFNSIKRFPPGQIRRYRRYVYVGAFALAVVLPFTYDPITQLIMAVPIILLYEISLLLLWLVNRKAKKQAKIESVTEPTPTPIPEHQVEPVPKIVKRRRVQLG